MSSNPNPNPKSKIQNPNSKIQNPNSKIQNPNSKIRNPKSEIQIQTTPFGAAAKRTKTKLIQNPKSKIQTPKIFFLAQPNERLSIVGHLDTSATMIKKMPAAHAKHRTKHKKPTHTTTTTQHNKGTARAVGKVKKVRR